MSVMSTARRSLFGKIAEQYVVAMIFLVVVICLQGCIAVKQEAPPPPKPRAIQFADKPTIPMSDDIIASDAGDFVAHLPKGWFLVNHESKGLQNVFAVGTNPDYTLSIVLSSMKRDDEVERVYQRDGLIGLAKLSLYRRSKRTQSPLKMIGTPQEVIAGTKEYTTYSYTDDDSVTITRVAICRSTLGNIYEASLAEFTFSGKSLPPKVQIEQTFASILAMTDF